MSTTFTPEAAVVTCKSFVGLTIGWWKSTESSGTITEIIGSGNSVQTPQNGVFSKRYRIFGIDDDQEVRRLVQRTAPSLLNNLPITTIETSAVGHLLWQAEVQYTAQLYQRHRPSYSFNTSGTSQHVGTSISTRGASSINGQPVPNYGGAINVTANGGEGLDITVPNLTYSETHRYTPSTVTAQYVATLASLTGTVNNQPFLGFAAGEMLFTGASGSYNDYLVSITFNFEIQANSVVFGLAKAGWDFMWIKYDDVLDEAAGVTVKQPRAVYVEQVYPYGNFSLLQMPTWVASDRDPGGL